MDEFIGGRPAPLPLAGRMHAQLEMLGRPPGGVEPEPLPLPNVKLQFVGKP